MRAFRLNGWQRGGIAAAFAISIAGIVAYLDCRSFQAETRAYLGVTFEDTRSVVLYRLGYPDGVIASLAPGDPTLGLNRVYHADRTKDEKDPLNAMPGRQGDRRL